MLHSAAREDNEGGDDAEVPDLVGEEEEEEEELEPEGAEGDVGAFGEAVVGNTVTCHGRVWSVVPDVTVDQAAEDAGGVKHEAQIRWGGRFVNDDGERTLEQIFYRMFPMASIDQIIAATNVVMKQRNLGKPTTRGELLKCFGLRLAMVIEPRKGGVEAYWNAEDSPETTFTPADFQGRFQMSCSRFKRIWSAFRLSPPQGDGEPKDPWHLVRPFIDAFNANMFEAVDPGYILCVDEIMSSWKGLSQVYTTTGIPHVTKIPLKPEGVGAELKALADGETGTLIRLDMMEGKEAMKLKAYNAEVGNGTGCVLRLGQPYAGVPRMFVTDSAFASVKTEVNVQSKLGMRAAGIVKTAHREYPKAWLKEWHKGLARGEIQRGAWVVLASNYTVGGEEGGKPQKLYAVGWADKKLKSIVTNCGITVKCPTDSERVRNKVVRNAEGELVDSRMILSVQRPWVIELFYRCLATIDQHDQLRQSFLAFERLWHTKQWWHRIFMTILGVIFTNTFLTYKFEYKRAQFGSLDGADDFKTVLGKLAKQLIFNSYLPGEDKERKARKGPHGLALHQDDDDVEPRPIHEMRPLSQLPLYRERNDKADEGARKRARRTCAICAKQCAYYCVCCSNVDTNNLTCFCVSTAHGGSRNCSDQHRADALNA
jgi:hypothetical protein